MRIFGFLLTAVGFGTVCLGVVLHIIAPHDPLVWLYGLPLLASGIGVLVWLRNRDAISVGNGSGPSAAAQTRRFLDSFEQQFSQLKARKPSVALLQDLHTLGSRLEQKGRISQAIQVYRHLTGIDASFSDAAQRLARLTAADTPSRARPTPAPAPASGNTAAPAGEGRISQLGRYRLEREIGRGAMGVVYLGRDTAINREVAIKAIPLASEFSEAELAEARMRFFREAETAGRLNHPCIVTIYDVGEQHGLAYIAMEYLKGRHLSAYTSPNTLLEPRKVLDLIGRTAAALGVAHKRDVVHRDIKPANLMYEASSDTLKITDFGIARITGAGSTRSGIVLGTPSFMSPEQLEGQTVTGHSDLFSLGVSLFQLLTGQLPFQADSMTGLMKQIAEEPHPPLRAFRPDLPACVDALVDRALAKHPAARFDSGAHMASVIEDCRKRMASGMP